MKQYTLVKQGHRYKTDYFKTKPSIAESKGKYYEVVEGENPNITDNEVLLTDTAINEVDGTYIITYSKRDKTPLELWKYPNWDMCLKISLADIETYNNLKELVKELVMWWDIQEPKFPRTNVNGYLEFYCNVILPKHTAVINQFGSLIQVVNKPVE